MLGDLYPYSRRMGRIRENGVNNERPIRGTINGAQPSAAEGRSDENRRQQEQNRGNDQRNGDEKDKTHDSSMQ